MEHTYRTNILFLLLLLYASSSSSSCHTGRPAVLSQDTYFLPSDASATPISSYLAERALNPGCNNNDNAFWLGPEHVSGASFVLDYGDGAPVEADGFYLRNARNFAGDRCAFLEKLFSPVFALEFFSLPDPRGSSGWRSPWT